METREKEVRFDLYCSKCKHWKKSEWEDPCDECLHEPSQVDSHRPINFEEERHHGHDEL